MVLNPPYKIQSVKMCSIRDLKILVGEFCYLWRELS